ncbi:MAG: lipid A biosynthesis acyltransferase [Chitinophagaceae bacterium]|nr:lipid A biosynthesis acyltransferase [Chitinophagaceae bacterium]
MYYVVYGFLWLLSLLPFRVLYIISDFIYAIVFYLFKYRREVVMNNLGIAFPEKTEAEKLKIAKQFYHNLIDTFIESVKFISISVKTALKRSSADIEPINELIEKGYNVHAMGCHQFNWEYAAILYPLKLKAPFVGVYMPIANKILNRIFYNMRKRHGTVLVSATEFKTRMHHVFSGRYVLALAADQNPGDPSNAYWVNFFGRPAPFVTGPAKGAVKNNTAIIMAGFKKIKRGHYHFDCKVLTESASQFTPQQLTVMYKNEVERIIRQDPANYLWSHRRWKYEWKPEYGNILD